MASLMLYNQLHSDITVVSNRFIDEYMVDAGGEFVKIYLYLLRCAGNPLSDLSISAIADTFDHTENDVRRALKYWEKMKLLRLTYDSDKTIAGITFLDFQNEMTSALEVTAVTEQHDSSVHIIESSKSIIPDSLTDKDLNITPDKLKALNDKEDIKQLLFVCEQYLGKTLSYTDTKTVLYFYDTLHFSADLIEYLIEYCVSKGSKSIHYIQSVALAWAKDNIKTVNQAKEHTTLYNKRYFTILKAFGIKGRNPVKPEILLMDSWLDDYAFTIDIITEACNRTIAQTNQPSFKYADKILADWHHNGVKHLSDIAKLDEEHLKTKALAAASAKKKSVSNNKFNNFDSRERNYNSLEQQLLNSK
jgi:DnaD/phage-associated family protein